MSLQQVLTVQEAERFCDTYDSFKSSVGKKPNGIQLQALRNAVGVDNKSSSVITRWCLFYKIHGRKKFIDFFARGIGPKHSDQDYIRILEYAVSSGTPIDRVWVIFRCSRRKLEKLSAKRKKAETWPQVEPATPPDGVVRLLEETSLNERVLSEHSAEEAVPEQSVAEGTGGILRGDTIIAVGSTAQEVVHNKPHKHIHGKSKKEVITLQRPKYKPRRKDVAAAKKEQDAIKLAQARGAKALAKIEQTSPLSSAEVSVSKSAIDVDIAYASLKAELKDPAEYDPDRRGRKPNFNPFAEGFCLLPQEVQQSSLAYYGLMEQAFYEAKLVAKQVPTTATQDERFRACFDFTMQHPEYPLKVVIVPFGFKYDNFKYYAKYRPKCASEDPYVKSGAYRCLVKCFNESNSRYGKYRLRQMMYDRGYHYCVPTIAKLMRRCNLEAVSPSSKQNGSYSSYQGTVGQLSPNLLNRDFKATAPFQKIVSDVTELNYHGTKIYLSVFKDLFNNEIRSYSISNSPSVSFVVAGLKKLIESIPENAKCIINTDQGHQYQRKQYRDLFDQHPNIIQSMSRKGNCYDNGPCESWFARFKDDRIKGQTFASIDDLVVAINSYIYEYNNHRIQMGLHGMSPVAYAHWCANQSGRIVA